MSSTSTMIMMTMDEVEELEEEEEEQQQQRRRWPRSVVVVDPGDDDDEEQNNHHHQQSHHHHQQQQLKNNNIRGGRRKRSEDDDDDDDDANQNQKHHDVILLEDEECEYPRRSSRNIIIVSNDDDDDDDDESFHHHRQHQKQQQQVADIGILSDATADVVSFSQQQHHDHHHVLDNGRRRQRLSFSSSSCPKRNQICQPNAKSKLGGICVDVTDVDDNRRRRRDSDDDDDDFVVYVGNNVYYDDTTDHHQPMYTTSLLLDPDATTQNRRRRYLNDDDNCFYQDGFYWDIDLMTGRRECIFMKDTCDLFDGYCEEIDNYENQPCVTISQLYLFENQLLEDVPFSNGVCSNFTFPYKQSICTFITTTNTGEGNNATTDSSDVNDDDVSNKVCEIYFDNEKCSKCTISSKVPGVASYCIEFDCTNTELKSFGSTEMNGFAMFPILQSKKMKKAECTFDTTTAKNSMPLFHFGKEPRCAFHITESSSGKVIFDDGNGIDAIYRGLIGLLVGFTIFLIITFCLFKFWKPMPPISSFTFKNLIMMKSKKKNNNSGNSNSNNKNQQNEDDYNNVDTENHSQHDGNDDPVVVLPVVDGHQL